MIYCYTNNSVSRLGKLGRRYCHSKKQSYDQKISNLTFLFIKKKYIATRIVLILTNILVEMLILPLILLDIIFIFTTKSIYKLYI